MEDTEDVRLLLQELNELRQKVGRFERALREIADNAYDAESAVFARQTLEAP